MAHWLTLVVVGCLIYCFTLTPIFPAPWSRAAQVLGGLLVIVGLLIVVLGLLGIGLP